MVAIYSKLYRTLFVWGLALKFSKGIVFEMLTHCSLYSIYHCIVRCIIIQCV